MPSKRATRELISHEAVHDIIQSVLDKPEFKGHSSPGSSSSGGGPFRLDGSFSSAVSHHWIEKGRGNAVAHVHMMDGKPTVTIHPDAKHVALGKALIAAFNSYTPRRHNPRERFAREFFERLRGPSPLSW